MNAKEAGQAFLAEVLAQLPAEQQAQARTAFEASEQALTTLGAGVLRQSDYSRQMDAVRESQNANAVYKTQLDDWWTENAAKVTQQPAAPVAPVQPVAPAGNFLTREQLDAERKTWEARYAGALAATTSLASRHYAEFQKPLDVEALLRSPEINQLGLAGVYEKTFKADYDAKAQAADTARIDAEVNRRLAAERQTHLRHPYPVNGRDASPLDAIEDLFVTKVPGDPATPGVAGVSVVDRASQQYADAVARHQASGSV